MRINRLENKKSRVNLVFAVAAGVLVAASVFLSIKYSVEGGEILALERQGLQLAEENRGLSEKLVSVTSLSAVGTSVLGLGMVKPTNLIYLSETAGVSASLR